MVEKSAYIASLLLKSLREELSEAESREWQSWLTAHPDHSLLINEFTKADLLKKELAYFREAGTEERLDTLIKKFFNTGDPAALSGNADTLAERGGIRAERTNIPAERADTPILKAGAYAGETAVVSYSRLRQTNWLKYAALFILVAGAGTFLWLTAGSRNENTAARTQVANAMPDIPAPEGDKARLLLEDGTVITLDTLSNGILGREGNTSIVKLSDGQLAYNTNKAFTGKVAYNTIVTPRGGHYQVTLPDGTRVWLNAASSLRFPTSFTEKDRTVELKGEAYFDVAPASAAGHPELFSSRGGPIPLTVLVNDMKVLVLGTQFNIKAYEEEQSVKTTLAEGRVVVTVGNKTLLLNPSEQAVLTGSGRDLSKVTADLYKELAWKNGMFVFDDDDITNIMGELSRWYDVDVSIEGDILNSHYSGVVRRSENISQVLNMLKTAGGINFIIENRNIKVLPDM